MSNLLQQFTEVRNYTVALCEPLQTEDYIPQSASFTSPPKWHLAHTTWFFEEMILKKHLEEYEEHHPDFGFLFNSYYQSIGKRANRAERGLITRPTVNEVYTYREYVDEGMKKLLSKNISREVENLVILGLNHEQQHQELLLTDLKYTLSLNPIYPIYHSSTCLVACGNENEHEYLKIPGGIYEIGYEGKNFCFDNELSRHKTYIDDFSISNHLVTNGAYIEFIKAGGYNDFKYWLDEGWAWVKTQESKCPLYWVNRAGKWHNFTLAGLKPINEEDILCHVNFYEAQAYATWRGLRLPTEQEWEIAAPQLNWGARWEWTSSAYMPYPGFAVDKGALGEYNGKFMVNQIVLRGASAATSPGHSRPSYRNFFHPQYQWQLSGIRLAK